MQVSNVENEIDTNNDVILRINIMRSLNTYRGNIKKTFSFLKNTEKYHELWVKNIPLSKQKGYLIPICNVHKDDMGMIEKLSLWRDVNSFAYPSQFKVTPEGTKFWLKEKLLDVEDRILFLVIDELGNAVGHIGFANGYNDDFGLEIDNVVRGCRLAPKGIMTDALLTLINWAEETLWPDEIYLRVFMDNEHAVSFYEKSGFVKDKLIPLQRIEKNWGVFYNQIECDKAADKYFLRMVYKPEGTLDLSKTILTAGPSISAKEATYIHDAVRTGWNNNWGGYLKRFESSFSEYFGVKYALATSSCTGALHLSLLALGIGPGDEVIVPDITWVATANAVAYVGATPIFADIAKDSWCLDPVSFESKITSKTKAVIPVHLYGHPAAMNKILEIARTHNLYVVEDAAPAIGACWQGKKVGTFGDFAAFSFQGAKLLVTGEGGMLLTNSKDLYERAYTVWDQGRMPGTFWINQLGLKYKMSNIQAALGLGQLERVEELIDAKRRIFQWYADELADVPSIQLNYEIPEAFSIYWMTSIILSSECGITRNQTISELGKCNIDSRQVFPAISQYPYWVKKQEPQPNALLIGNNGINLPSGVCLRQNQVNYICKCIKNILRKL